ncbi:MAG: hypothetical protein HXY30_06010, partial [Pseudorhodoplanes sp.]|nr:hypothetical protein [Pseudorhodoplanes sp.]
MRSGVAIIAASTAVAALACAPARADHQPAFVIPGRLDVPVIVNGYNAGFGIVEGDWGLYRPGAGTVVVIPSPYAPPFPPPARHYFPSLGAAPKLGRYEIEPSPDREKPKQAESFSRGWSVSSDMDAPVTEYAPSPPISPDVNVWGGNWGPGPGPGPW